MDFFDLIPEHVLEKVLSYLPDRELASFACLNTTVFRLANKIVRRKFFSLLKAVEDELEDLQSEIEALSLNQIGLLLRIFDFRSHVAFEFLRSEMTLMRSLGRGVLLSSEKAVLFARVTPHYQLLFAKAKERNLARLKVNDDLINKIINPSKLLVAKIFKESLSNMLPLGTRILDLLDCLLKKELHVAVKFCFHQSLEFVVVDATYQFVPLNLYSPPMLTRTSEEREKTLANPDDALTAVLIEYLFNVIRLNNKSYLKEASYEREEEFNSRRQSVAVLQHGLGAPLAPPLRWLNQQPASYSLKNVLKKKSFRTDQESFWIKHRYKSGAYTGRLAMNRKEFKCRVCITCDIKDSPFVAQLAWQEIIRDCHDPQSPLFAKHMRQRICSVGVESTSSSSSDETDTPAPDEEHSGLAGSSMEAKIEVVLNASEFGAPNAHYELFTLNIME